MSCLELPNKLLGRRNEENEVEEVRCVINRMKIDKASGPSGVAIELFKTGVISV